MKYFIWLPVFFCLLLSTALNTSLVYDEVIYAPAGVQYWKTNDVGWNSEHPPFHKYISSLLLLTQPLINVASR
jgi:dolichyl-phosphate-mannose--protein O-mannosyl transferase